MTCKECPLFMVELKEPCSEYCRQLEEWVREHDNELEADVTAKFMTSLIDGYNVVDWEGSTYDIRIKEKRMRDIECMHCKKFFECEGKADEVDRCIRFEDRRPAGRTDDNIRLPSSSEKLDYTRFTR